MKVLILFIQTQTNFAKFVIRKYLQFYTYYRYFVFHSYLRNTKKRQDQQIFFKKEIVPSRQLTTHSKCRLPVNQGCPAYLPVGTFLARNTPASRCFPFAILFVRMPPYANVRRIILKHRRAAKCPLLQKFTHLCLKEARGNFIPTQEIFESYESALALWTDEDSVRGQTSFLIKRRGFNQVGIYRYTFLDEHNIRT